jgi:spermidine synthase
MAALLEPDDELTFYEIDPAVIDLATDQEVFGFIDDSAGDVRIVQGDGRLSLAGEPQGSLDLVVIDAFSSDAIPVHLLTREALATYRATLGDEGVVAFHVSNRYFDLLPVVARLAEDAGLSAVARHGIGDVPGASVTTAVAVGEPDDLAALEARGWRPVPPSGTLWTDDHADVLGALVSLNGG